MGLWFIDDLEILRIGAEVFGFDINKWSLNRFKVIFSKIA